MPKIKNPAHQSLIGQIFNGLTVTSFSHVDNNGFDVFNCNCHCGGKTQEIGRHLKMNRVRSCGCANEFEPITGLQFKDIKIIRKLHNRRDDRYIGLCSCGVEFGVLGTQVRNRYIRSCGCKRIHLDIGCRRDETEYPNFSTLESDVLNKSRGLLLKSYRNALKRNVQEVDVIDVGRYYNIETGVTTATEKELKLVMKYFNLDRKAFDEKVAKIAKKVKQLAIEVGMETKMTLLDLIDIVIHNFLIASSKK